MPRRGDRALGRCGGRRRCHARPAGGRLGPARAEACSSDAASPAPAGCGLRPQAPERPVADRAVGVDDHGATPSAAGRARPNRSMQVPAGRRAAGAPRARPRGRRRGGRGSPPPARPAGPRSCARAARGDGASGIGPLTGRAPRAAPGAERTPGARPGRSPGRGFGAPPRACPPGSRGRQRPLRHLEHGQVGRAPGAQAADSGRAGQATSSAAAVFGREIQLPRRTFSPAIRSRLAATVLTTLSTLA